MIFYAWLSGPDQGCNWKGATNYCTNRGEDIGPGFHLERATLHVATTTRLERGEWIHMDSPPWKTMKNHDMGTHMTSYDHWHWDILGSSSLDSWPAQFASSRRDWSRKRGILQVSQTTHPPSLGHFSHLARGHSWAQGTYGQTLHWNEAEQWIVAIMFVRS